MKCSHGTNTCGEVETDCCSTRPSCNTVFVPEAGVYCKDGKGCNRR